MDFATHFSTEPLMLTGGSIYERLRRHPEVSYDPDIKHAALIYSDAGRAALEVVYREYMSVAVRHSLPMMVYASTWRASAARLAGSPFAGLSVNQDNVAFTREVATRMATETSPFYVAGVLGCSGDAYRPDEALPCDQAARFHAPQVAALVAAEPDVLVAATLPALSEARGIATCFDESGLPYLLSFVVRDSGTLLDGTPLRQALDLIDAERARPPIGYMVNCVHPSVLERCLDAAGPEMSGRIVGLRANTSSLRPEELVNAEELITQPPTALAGAMRRVQRRGLRILGGCCGTGTDHIEAIATACKPTA